MFCIIIVRGFEWFYQWCFFVGERQKKQTKKKTGKRCPRKTNCCLQCTVVDLTAFKFFFFFLFSREKIKKKQLFASHFLFLFPTFKFPSPFLFYIFLIRQFGDHCAPLFVFLSVTVLNSRPRSLFFLFLFYFIPVLSTCV